MQESEIERIAGALKGRYLLVRKSGFFYAVGGAVAAIIALTGATITSVRSQIETRVSETVDVQIQKAADRLDNAILRMESRAQALEDANLPYGLKRTLVQSGPEKAEQREEFARGERLILSLSGDRDGRAHSIPIDHDSLIRMCGDIDGCRITMAARPFETESNLGDRFTSLLAFGNGGACHFFYEPTRGDWAVEESCSTWRKKIVWDRERREFVEPSVASGFRPYSTASAFGYDGNDVTFSVISYANICYLSEAPHNPEFFDGQGAEFQLDRDDGLYLVMAGAHWTAYPRDIIHPSNPDRECRLIIDD